MVDAIEVERGVEDYQIARRRCQPESGSEWNTSRKSPGATRVWKSTSIGEDADELVDQRPPPARAVERSGSDHYHERTTGTCIVDIQLARLQKLLDERKIELDLDQSAREWLAEKGYDPVYGARPLKRVIQREVQDPLADKMLAGEIPEGARVKITGGTDKLLFLPRVTGGKADKGKAA